MDFFSPKQQHSLSAYIFETHDKFEMYFNIIFYIEKVSNTAVKTPEHSMLLIRILIVGYRLESVTFTFVPHNSSTKNPF
jgi:hypothetical protein